MELWLDGKLIAKAIKDKISCSKVQGNGSVTVNPLTVTTTAPNRPVYAHGPPYPFYDPWGFSYYGAFGYRPYGRAFIGYPIFIGGHRGRR